MAAYNWIKTEFQCPNCLQVVVANCQTHVASDYNGDATGRFFDRTYNLGERMVWWSKSDPNYNDWCDEYSIKETNFVESCKEACYVACPNCGTDLYVVVLFEDITPVKVLSVGLEKNWPDEFPR